MKNKQIRRKSGQSMLELVFAIGVVVIVITGVVILLVNTINVKNRGFDRKKAAELGQVIMEDLVNQKKNDPDNFWKLDDYVPTWVDSSYDNYSYSVGFTNVTNDPVYPKCGIGATDCANVVVKIGWSGSQSQSSVFQRFFSRK